MHLELEGYLIPRLASTNLEYCRIKISRPDMVSIHATRIIILVAIHGAAGRGASVIELDDGLNTPIAACSATTNNTCAAGKFGCVDTGDGCEQCPIGKWAAAKSPVCTNCPAGKSSAPEAAAAADCKDCPAGKISAAGQICSDCASGKAAPTAGSTSCTVCAVGKAWKNSAACQDCNPGQFAPAVGAGQCDYCPRGKSSAAAAIACTNCTAGKYADGGSECTACSGNEISGVGAFICAPPPTAAATAAPTAAP